jgi:hypothetical protein
MSIWIKLARIRQSGWLLSARQLAFPFHKTQGICWPTERLNDFTIHNLQSIKSSIGQKNRHQTTRIPQAVCQHPLFLSSPKRNPKKETHTSVFESLFNIPPTTRPVVKATLLYNITCTTPAAPLCQRCAEIDSFQLHVMWHTYRNLLNYSVNHTSTAVNPLLCVLERKYRTKWHKRTLLARKIIYTFRAKFDVYKSG